MGRDEITLADVRDALRRVGLLKSVMDFPDGLNTMLWPGGHPLSLGQANRLMIARAVVGRPRLLILDETMDNMDAELRAAVWPAIQGRGEGWTLLVITHSDDVARLCDRVVRLEKAEAPAHH
jgi:putative ABC transport system ATP-binding protein